MIEKYAMPTEPAMTVAKLIIYAQPTVEERTKRKGNRNRLTVPNAGAHQLRRLSDTAWIRK
jgi:hypothetical protein